MILAKRELIPDSSLITDEAYINVLLIIICYDFSIKHFYLLEIFMKLLTLALLVAGFSICTLSAADSHEEATRKHKKCVHSKGSIKPDGRCMRKGQELQAYTIKK